MSKKSQPKTNPEPAGAPDQTMSKAEAMDIIYQMAAEAKQEINEGRYYTHEQMGAIIDTIKKSWKLAKK